MKLLRSIFLILPVIAILAVSGCAASPEQKYAVIETNLGSFKIELFTKDSPKTVENFIKLAEQGFYDDIIFHRIIKDFMIQTGDPLGTGFGGPGYKFDDELPVKRSYQPGIVAMANSGPNTNGSQFFICSGPLAVQYLDSNPAYTQFGKIVEGMDVVLQIAAVPVVLGSDGNLSKPVDPPYMISVTITTS
ncbi:peptidyl-prolyl cis-trans isomerase [Dehalogenimonas sp. WBC-2]|nr:peptidyl-prolyl cis-trans isomerase [Dehalogenimonas sp. WBC-2]